MSGVSGVGTYGVESEVRSFRKMRCNPWRWLWGLIPIAMLSWIVFNWEHRNIEADLGQRAAAELERQGIDWAELSFSGRDAVLRGRSSEEDAPKRAVDAVRSLWGVRVVDQRTDLVPKAEVYTWKATRNKGKLTISGHAPSEAARKSILSVARSNFPKAEIEDVMQLARGAPPQDIWLGGTNFALRQLAELERGTVDLSGVSLSLSGEAADASGYKSVRQALEKMPSGIKLAKSEISPAVASPFLWSAKLASDNLVVAGHVPGEEQREQIFSSLRSKFGNRTIVDQTEVAGGAPDGWSKAVGIVVDQFASLEDATAEFRGVELAISGKAADAATAEAIRKALRGLPAAYKVDDAITFPEPQPAPSAEASPPPAETPAVAATEPPGTGIQVETPAGGIELKWGSPEQGATRQKSEEADRNAKWSELEKRWEERNTAAGKRRSDEDAARRQSEENEAQRIKAEEEAARRKAEEDAKARRATEEEARRAKWVELELRWGTNNEAYEQKRKADEARRQTEAAVQETRKVEANNCQALMRDAVKKGRILFPNKSASLDKSSEPTLQKLVKISAACPNARIEISGHTDIVGDRDFNQELSEKRAQAIVSYLKGAGLDTSRLTAKGFGSDRPVAPNTTQANKAKNRRIEFTVVPN